jgi:hypothetical protein
MPRRGGDKELGRVMRLPSSSVPLGTVSAFDRLQQHLRERVMLLRRERRSVSRQRNLIFTLSVVTAVAAVGLVLYGLALVTIDVRLSSFAFPELTGLATGLASGSFGWLTKGLLARLEELDCEEKEEIQLQSLMAYVDSIHNRDLRDKVTAYIAGVLAGRAYGVATRHDGEEVWGRCDD